MATLTTGWSQGIDASPLLTPLALVIGLAALAWFAFFSDRWRLLGPALAVPAVLFLAMDRLPDVLIADTTQAVALRTDEGLQLITGKPDTFAVTIWGETYAQAIGSADADVASCDSVGCIAKSAAGFRVALIRDPSGFAEDCAVVELIITRRKAPDFCRELTQVIDSEDLLRGGTQWLAWKKGQGTFETRPAMIDLNRPWRAARW